MIPLVPSQEWGQSFIAKSRGFGAFLETRDPSCLGYIPVVGYLPDQTPAGPDGPGYCRQCRRDPGIGEGEAAAAPGRWHRDRRIGWEQIRSGFGGPGKCGQH